MTKTYAVTGCASGIGAEIARILKRSGHRIVGFDLRETSLNVDQFVPLDLNDPTSIQAAADAATGPFDGLCNNAGLPPRAGLETAILQVNFFGQRQFTNALLPKLKTGASIVNMASRAGAQWRDHLDQCKRLAALTSPDQIAPFIDAESIDATRCYNLSKEAMILWTLAMTEDMIKRDIRINSLSPGAISTGILDDFVKAFGEKMARNVERAGRPGNPEEIGEIAAFLLSPASNWIKGVDLSIDGGMSAFNLADMLDVDVMKGSALAE